MKKILNLILFFFALSVHAQKSFNLDVEDQNFNSTEKIIIDQEEIRKSRATSLPNLLEAKANINVVSTNMQPSSIFIRGGDSSHVLILVDGVPTYDSSTSQRTMNLYAFNLSKVKKIEVLKGSQSVTYGGQALSGVIKITTVDENNIDPSRGVVLEVGAARNKLNRKFISADALNPIAENLYFLANVYGVDEKNFSTVENSDKLYPKKNYGAELGLYKKGDWSHLFKLAYNKDSSDIIASGAKPFDTDNQEYTDQSASASLVSQLKDFANLTAIYRQSNRKIYQSKEDMVPVGTEDTNYNYKGHLFDLRADFNLVKMSSINLNVGAALTAEKMKNVLPNMMGVYTETKADQQLEGIYSKIGLKLSQETLLEMGYRLETEKLKKLADSYQIGLSKTEGDSTIKAEYSAGFKTASLFQKYAADYGNPDLKPEYAKNVSLSMEHKFNDNIYGSVAFFSTSYENLITYVGLPPTGQYENVSQSKTSGVELASQIKLYQDILNLGLSYGYQEPKDLSKGVWLARRSLQSGSARLSGKITDDQSAGLEVVHYGSRIDTVRLNSYQLVNVYYNLTLTNRNMLFARVDNIFSKEYESVRYYINKGWVAKLGTEIKF